jgi:hypothetical protein
LKTVPLVFEISPGTAKEGCCREYRAGHVDDEAAVLDSWRTVGCGLMRAMSSIPNRRRLITALAHQGDRPPRIGSLLRKRPASDRNCGAQSLAILA